MKSKRSFVQRIGCYVIAAIVVGVPALAAISVACRWNMLLQAILILCAASELCVIASGMCKVMGEE